MWHSLSVRTLGPLRSAVQDRRPYTVPGLAQRRVGQAYEQERDQAAFDVSFDLDDVTLNGDQGDRVRAGERRPAGASNKAHQKGRRHPAPPF
jgi:hypothetical protein